jgi:hypothetical protein
MASCGCGLNAVGQRKDGTRTIDATQSAFDSDPPMRGLGLEVTKILRYPKVWRAATRTALGRYYYVTP